MGEGGWITNLTAKERIWIFKIKKKEEEGTEQIVAVPSLPSISEWSVKEELDVL